MSQWIVNLVARLQARPWQALAGLFGITVLALAALTQLQINATPYLLDRDHPSRVTDHDVKRLFGNTGEQAYVAVGKPGQDVFNPESLATVKRLTEAFAQLRLDTPADTERLKVLADQPALTALLTPVLADGLHPDDAITLRSVADDKQLALIPRDRDFIATLALRLDPVRKVRSLVTLENITPSADGVDVHPLMRKLPTDAGAIAALRAEVFGNPLYRKALISDDGHYTSIQVEFDIPEDDSPSMLLAYQALSAVLVEQKVADQVALAGPPMVAAQTAATMEHDNQILMPGVMLAIIVVLFLSFGRAQGVGVPLLVAVLSLVWTLGLMAAFGVKQNIVSAVLPVFIISIAVCDAIHFLAHYYHLLPPNPGREDRRFAALETLKHLLVPMFMTSITTFAGFLSLAYTQISFIFEFGVFTALGVAFAWIITIIALPVILTLWSGKPLLSGLVNSERFADLTVGLALTGRRGRFIVYGLLLVMAGGAGYVATQLEVDNQVIGYFEDDSRIRQDDALINQHFGGTTPVNFLLEANRPDALKDPAVLSAIDKIEARLREHQQVGYVLSPVGFVKRLHQTLDDDHSAAGFALPTLSTELLAQYFLMYENASGRDLFDVVDRRFQNARVVTMLHTDRSSEVQAVLEDVTAYAKQVLPAGVSVRTSGYGEILVTSTREVVHGQIQSILMAGVLIAVMVIVLFRSLKLGLLAMLPLAFTMITGFALMSALGVALDIGTSIVAAITFGIGIDYAIYVVTEIRRGAGRSQEEAVIEAMRRSGRPILINTAALTAGFLVLLASGYQALNNLGLLVALTMLLSAVFALSVLPALVPVDGEPEDDAEPLSAATEEGGHA